MRIFFVLLFLCIGCCPQSRARNETGNSNTNVGIYSTVVGKLLKKHEGNDCRKVEFKTEEKVKLLKLPSSLSEDWWLNFIEGENYEVTIEEKNDWCGKSIYIWDYKPRQYVLNEEQWKYEPLIGK